MFLAAVFPSALTLLAAGPAGTPRELQTGIAGHAFDHLGGIGDQAAAAAASGANIIYVTGLGSAGYSGLPTKEELLRLRQATMTYLGNAKRNGISLALGYLCATSIVKLDDFDKNWPPELRGHFRTRAPEWRQRDRNGQPLPSWYGGDYQPACMNNPDWRAYERFMVRQQLEAGCDGIFFDNPTVHPEGCYCRFCMEKFAGSLGRTNGTLAEFREYAATNRSAFMSFRCTIARDFLEEMRNYARARKPSALVTANNSLNAAQVLYAQCRGYAYNIYEMSQVEDFVVVEDMSSQPRILENGRMFEYSPTYKLLHAISHGKPIVAVTIAEADYHTAPNLVRLAMAEAAANNASYLSWPTWPEEQRQRMISLIRPQADLLRKHAALLNETQPRRDVLLFLPFRKWLESDQCRASRLAAELSRANIQYEVICEDDLAPPEMAPLASGKSAVRPALALPDKLRVSRVLVSSSLSDFTPKERVVLEKFSRTGGNLITAEKPDWLQQTITRIGKLSVYVDEPPTVRVLVRDQPKRTIVHLLNLNVQRISSFEDKVTPASNVRVSVRVPFGKVRLVTALSSDSHGGSQPLQFSASRRGGESDVEITVPKLEIATILVIQ